MENSFWTEVKDTHFFTKLKKDILIDFLKQRNLSYPEKAKVSELKIYILENFYSEFRASFPDRMVCIRNEEYTDFHYQLHSYCKKVIEPYSYLANCEIITTNMGTEYIIPNSELNRIFFEYGHKFDLNIKNNPYIVLD